MKIAIIGGGASGMVAAYRLDLQGHAVTVYEQQSSLGGHIRTLNQNIPHQTDCPDLLEAGVLEFPTEFTNFLQLMQDLQVPVEPVEIGSGLFFQDGRHFLSPVMIDRNFRDWRKWREVLHIDSLYARAVGLWLKTHLASMAELRGTPLSAYLHPERPRTIWVKLLTMYSYSMPYETIDDFPADLAIPALRRYVFSNWVRIKGGVYSYIEKILSRFSGEVFLDTTITDIHRSDHAVQISGSIAGAPIFHRQFDRLIFATPPDQVLRLLADPRPDERRRFQAWKPNYATTILHHDQGLYIPHGIQQGCEFDFFQTQTSWGYNAALCHLCGTDRCQAYSLAFNLKEIIRPETIIHEQQHHTPFYDVKSFRYRDEVIATNGQNHTYHVGAYLGDGLHEGAITSAINVADVIGPANVEQRRSSHPLQTS